MLRGCSHPTQYPGIFEHAPGCCDSPPPSPILLSPPSSGEDDATQHYTPETPTGSPTFGMYLDASLEEEEDWSKKYYVDMYSNSTKAATGFATARFIQRIKDLVGHLDIEYVGCYLMTNGTECYTFTGTCPIHFCTHSANKFQYKKDVCKKFAGWKCFHDDSFKNDFYLE